MKSSIKPPITFSSFCHIIFPMYKKENDIVMKQSCKKMDRVGEYPSSPYRTSHIYAKPSSTLGKKFIYLFHQSNNKHLLKNNTRHSMIIGSQLNSNSNWELKSSSQRRQTCLLRALASHDNLKVLVQSLNLVILCDTLRSEHQPTHDNISNLFPKSVTETEDLSYEKSSSNRLA